jgi:hypothetical protein
MPLRSNLGQKKWRLSRDVVHDSWLGSSLGVALYLRPSFSRINGKALSALFDGYGYRVNTTVC